MTFYEQFCALICVSLHNHMYWEYWLSSQYTNVTNDGKNYRIFLQLYTPPPNIFTENTPI